MNPYMLGVLLLCLVAGLWAPRKMKVPAVVLTLTTALVLFFTLVTTKL
ncbi:MAG TPA: hypothetical protein VGR57_01340 [Ktedonobacterales bacterium]|nr:hypothetical protein [Ktedonobacterales bacterium]